MTIYRLVAIWLLAMTVLMPRILLAQEAVDAYPSKPVRIIVAQAPGGTDVQARLYAEKLSQNFGKQFVVENHPGLNIAWVMVAKAPADGYTLLVILPDFTFAPALYKDLPVDPVRDFEPVSLMSQAPYLLVVQPSLPAKSVRELITLARANPAKLNFGGGLPGTGTNLMSVLFISLTGIKASYVPYKGAAQAVFDLLGGHIDAVFSTAVPLLPHMKTGKLRALGISTAQRSTLLPSIPSIAEQGVAGFDTRTFHGWAAPTGTPPAIIQKLSAELGKIARLPDVVENLRADNSEPVGSTSAEFKQFIATEVPRWRKLVQDTGFKVQ